MPTRRRLDLRGELALALLPTRTILAMLFFLEALVRHSASSGSCSPRSLQVRSSSTSTPHGTNSMRTLSVSHVMSMLAGLCAYWVFGHSYVAAGAALVVSIFLMIVLDVVHPPAVGTSLVFAFRARVESDLNLFFTRAQHHGGPVILESISLWLLGRSTAP